MNRGMTVADGTGAKAYNRKCYITNQKIKCL